MSNRSNRSSLRPALIARDLFHLVVPGLLAIHWAWAGLAYLAAFFWRINPSDASIEPHEEAALLAMIGAVALGLLAAVALVSSLRRRRVEWLHATVIVAAVLVSGMLAWIRRLNSAHRTHTLAECRGNDRRRRT
jgi:hypothetical protein